MASGTKPRPDVTVMTVASACLSRCGSSAVVRTIGPVRFVAMVSTAVSAVLVVCRFSFFMMPAL